MYLYRMTGTVAGQLGLPALDLRRHANGWMIFGNANGAETVSEFVAVKISGGRGLMKYVVGNLKDWLAASDQEAFQEFAVLFLPGVRVDQDNEN